MSAAQQRLLAEADRSVAAYDAFIFTSIGHTFDADHADLLAMLASMDCEAAAESAKGREPAWLVDMYRGLAAEFAAIGGAT